MTDRRTDTQSSTAGADTSHVDAGDTAGPRSPSRRRLLRRALFGAALLGGPIGAYAHEVAPEEIGVTRLDVVVPGLPPEAHGLRIGHIGDTHCDHRRAANRAARAARLLRAERPDMVVMTGDYITHHPHEHMPAAAEALRTLADLPRGAFATLGNHDWWSGDPDFVAARLRAEGFQVLRNGAAEVVGSGGLWVVGLEQRCDNLQDPAAALRGVPEYAVKLLLIHEPDYADEAPAGFALQLSGHSHGGQVRLPGLPPIVVPQHSRHYPEGLRQAPSHRVFTTRGVGMVGPKFRLFCPPEVAVIRLLRART